MKNEQAQLEPKGLTAWQAQSLGLVPLSVTDKVIMCGSCSTTETAALAKAEKYSGRVVFVRPLSHDSFVAAFQQWYGAAPGWATDQLVLSVSQASKRRLEPSRDLAIPAPKTNKVRVLTVTGGKGGVGKSTLTANLGLALAKSGYSVGLVDADFGLPNLHVVFGCDGSHGLAKVLREECAFSDGFLPQHGGVWLLPGLTGVNEFKSLDYSGLASAGVEWAKLDGVFDYLLVDTSAGVSESVLSLCEASDEVLLVVTPDPASVLDGFVLASEFSGRKPNAKVSCVVNQAADAKSARMVAARLGTFVGLAGNPCPRMAGYVRTDKRAVESSRSRTPFVLGEPKSRASKDVIELAKNLALQTGPAAAKRAA